VDRHFLRHYAEMVLAMMIGMAVLTPPLDAALQLTGWSALVGMAGTMTISMIGWMRVRRHRWRACWEMAASMALPTVAAIGLLAANLVSDLGTLMLIEHVAMLPSMFVAMLLRPDEY
jgi:hypothetical protein